MRPAIVLGIGMLVAAPSHAADPIQRDLDAGLKKLSALRYKDAVKPLERVSRNPQANKAQRARANEALGECLLALRLRKAAEAAYLRLITDNPRADLRPGVEPKLREFFLEVKASKYPRNTVEFRREADAPDGSMTIRLLDPWRRVTRVARVARVGIGEWTRSVVSSADGMVYRALPPPPVPGERVEWFVEAQGFDGSAVASVGTASAVFVIDTSAPVAVAASPAPAPDAPRAPSPPPTPPAAPPAATDPAPTPAPAATSRHGPDGFGPGTAPAPAPAPSPSDVAPAPTAPDTVVAIAPVPAMTATEPKSATPEPAASAPAFPPAPPAPSGRLSWWIWLAAGVVAAGAGGGAAYVLAQRPSGQTAIRLGQKP